MIEKKILLVDDDADDQLFFLDALSEINSHIRCEIANNGHEALLSLESLPLPHVVFLDLNMPVMNGFDCLIELRKREELRALPVVIFTTTSDLATIKRMYEMGANAFFKKPNEFSTMRSKLETVLKTDFLIPIVRPSFSFAQFSL